jgi:hypothetical protein
MYKTTFRHLLISPWLLLPALLHPPTASAQIHLGPNQPYANIEAAVNAIQPGDTVYLHAGSYAGYQGVYDLKGTNSAWITITPYHDDPVDISGGWQFIRCAYLRFHHLNFQGNAAHPGRLFSVDNGGSCTTQSKFIRVDVALLQTQPTLPRSRLLSLAESTVLR